MSRRTRVYVAGPLTKGDRVANVRQMHDAATELRAAGYAPFCPVTSLADFDEDLTHEEWLGCDEPYVEIADALVRLPGLSVGAEQEMALAKELGIPVYHWLEELFQNEDPSRHGDDRIHHLLQSIGRLHDRKQADYGTSSDPFANVRASGDFGVDPWVGALIRLNDKVTRLKNFAVKRQLANESAIDSMLDIAVYALIAKVLYDEEA